jgi:hypothetical protein
VRALPVPPWRHASAVTIDRFAALAEQWSMTDLLAMFGVVAPA